MQTKTQQGAQAEVHPAYTIVYIILAALTLGEVGASYLTYSVKIPILTILAATKALLVILFFMHLKYDRPIFSAPILIGVFLALPIIVTLVLVMPSLFNR